MDLKQITYLEAAKRGLEVAYNNKHQAAVPRPLQDNPLAGINLPDLANLDSMSLDEKLNFYTSLSEKQIQAMPLEYRNDYVYTIELYDKMKKYAALSPEEISNLPPEEYGDYISVYRQVTGN